jgi:hypothetical protein
VLDGWKPTMDAWLEADREALREQRHTPRRVWQRLVDEHQAQVGESTVRLYRHVEVPAVVGGPGRSLGPCACSRRYGMVAGGAIPAMFGCCESFDRADRSACGGLIRSAVR